MTPNEYQTLAARTLIDAPDFEPTATDRAVVELTIAAAGTFGEIAEYVKKGLFHQHGYSIKTLLEKLSDYREDVWRGSFFDGPIPPVWNTRSTMMFWNVIGLVGEAGEIAGTVLAGVQENQATDREKLKKELGDCLWYLAALCTKADLSLEDVMHANIEKLKLRYPDGYSAEASKKRVDVENNLLV